MDAGYSDYNLVPHAYDLRLPYEVQTADTRSVINTKAIMHFESEVLHRLNDFITFRPTMAHFHHFSMCTQNE